MHLRCEALDAPVWRAWLAPDEHGEVALGGPGLVELEALLRRAETDRSCRVLVITSDGGPEFCRGMDLRGLASGAPLGGEGIARFARCLALLRTMRPATVCVIDGAASGGGVGLVAACDLVIAGPAASFALPELYFGLVPAVILPVIGERTGLARARWLALAGETLGGEAALRLGLVDERSEDPRRALAARIKHLLRISPDAVARLKRLVAEIDGMPLESALAAGVARTTADIAGPDVAAALASFHAGELPPWAVRPPRGEPV